MSAPSGELLELLRVRSFARRRVVLASGKESDFFIDCKQAVLTGRGHALVGEVMCDRIISLGVSPIAVAGVELGGCPLASAVALVASQKGRVLDAIYVRKTAKDHGSKRLMEGDTLLADGSKVVVLEDVVTTGGSTLAAVEKLRDRKLDVVAVIALVDRLEGGGESLRAAGLRFDSIYTRTDFIPAESS